MCSSVEGHLPVSDDRQQVHAEAQQLLFTCFFSGESFLARTECLARCSGGRRPLIAGCLSLQRLGVVVFVLRGCLGGATRKVQEFRGLRLRRQVAAGRRDHVHPRRSVGDMTNSLSISSPCFPYSNEFRMPLLQGNP